MITLAADIGGTSIKLGLVENDKVLVRDRVTVNDRSSLLPLLTPIAECWRRLLSGVDQASHRVSEVALAFAGAVDPRSGRVISTNGKFTDAPSLDLRGWAQASLGLPLYIDNDARSALVGEWQCGAGSAVNDLVMITLGTGMGAAAVVDGRVMRGSHGMTGILGGHLTLNLRGRRCSCGNLGCAEAEASTDRLPEIVAAMENGHGLRPSWRDNEVLDYALIFQQAEAGDPLATAVRDHSLAVWSAAVVNLVHAYGPRRVVLSGGITHGSPWLVEVIQQHVSRHAWTPWGPVEVCRAELGEDAILLGCGYLRQIDKDNVACR